MIKAAVIGLTKMGQHHAKAYSAIENVFERLKIKNNLSFFVTANHFQTQATCSAMPLGDSAEIILTSRLIELLNDEELQSVIAHEVAHFYYQHALYPQASNSKSRTEILNLLNFGLLPKEQSHNRHSHLMQFPLF